MIHSKIVFYPTPFPDINSSGEVAILCIFLVIFAGIAALMDWTRNKKIKKAIEDLADTLSDSQDEPINLLSESQIRNAKFHYTKEWLIKMIGAALDFYTFLKDVNSSNLVKTALNNIPGLKDLDERDNNFTVNYKLAVIAYCDLRQCFRTVGGNEKNLIYPQGIAFAIIIHLLTKPDFNTIDFFNQENQKKLLQSASQFSVLNNIRLTIEDAPNSPRFVTLFQKDHPDLASRYSELLKHWADTIVQ